MLQKYDDMDPPFKLRSLLIVTTLILSGVLFILIPMLSPPAQAYVHGIPGASSTFDEDNGPNDADPVFGSVRWSNGSVHYIEGDYMVGLTSILTIDAGCTLLFNGSFKIIVAGSLYARGTQSEIITFTSNSSMPGPGNWSAIEFPGGEGEISHCHIEYATEAIHLDSIQPITIENNTIINNTMGINGTHPSLKLANNNIFQNSLFGVRIAVPPSGLFLELLDCTIEGNQGGNGALELASDSGDITALISGSSFINNTENGIHMTSNSGDISVSITGCNFNQTGGNGTFIHSLSGNILALFTDNVIDGSGYEGIFIITEGGSSRLNATITDNSFTGNFYGIWLTNYWSNEGTDLVFNISNNNFKDNGDCIFVDVWGSCLGYIRENNITNTPDTAINCQSMDGATNYEISGNIIKNNVQAVYLSYDIISSANTTLSVSIENNTFINNTGYGIELWSSENITLTARNNIFDKNTYSLDVMAQDSSIMQLHNNTFTNDSATALSLLSLLGTMLLDMTGNSLKGSDSDNLYLSSTQGGVFNIQNNEFSGSTNSNGLYIDTFSGSGIFKNNLVSDNAQSGIEFWEGYNISIINSTFTNNLEGLSAFDSAFNITNSTISSIDHDFNLSGDSHATALNVSFDNQSASFGDSQSTLTVKWFLDVNVIDTGGQAVDNALVYVNDSLGTNEWTGTTGVGNGGWAYLATATEYIENLSGKTNRTPQDVKAIRDPEEGVTSTKVWTNHAVTVIINSKPEGEDIMPQGGAPQTLFRGDTIYINANTSDFTDPEDLLIPWFEYRQNGDLNWNATSFSGPATYLGIPPSGYWTVPFTASLSGPIGWYDFRVRFNDSTGAQSDYIYANSSVWVANNLPEALGLNAESGTVLRNDSVVIYATGSDREEAQKYLTPFFEYSLDGSTWEIDYFDGPAIWSSTYSRWEIIFNPPLYAELGAYDFGVRFSDTQGNFSQNLTMVGLVWVVNNPPTSTEIGLTPATIFRGESIQLYGRGYDLEDPLFNLTPHFECKRTNDSNWITGYLYDLAFNVNSWFINFTPTPQAPLGTYDFRVSFSDRAFYYSDWIYVNQSVNVQNNKPMAELAWASDYEVLRTGHIDIFVKGTDKEDIIENLRADFWYRLENETAWFNLLLSEPVHSAGALISTFTTTADTVLGTYVFRVRLNDSDNETSNWLYLSQMITVQNNPPVVLSADVLGPSVLRNESVVVYCEVGDIENQASALVPFLQFKPSGSPLWEDLIGPSFSFVNDRFEVSFTPSAIADLGDYDFRIKVTDLDETSSPWFYLNETLVVQNHAPSVLNLSLSQSEIFRGDTILVLANGEDGDMKEEDLAATFEYSLDGTTWSRSYLQNPQFLGGKWQVAFSAPIDALAGNYSFRVKFNDGDDESGWGYLFDALWVKNHLPNVTMDFSQDGSLVSFSCVVSDFEDQASSLVFLWDFGDGETSSLKDISHNYTQSGSYTVTLTVTDSDGGFSTSSTSVNVEIVPKDGKKEKSEGDLTFLILLVVILAAVVIILLLFLLRRKGPKEEEPGEEVVSGLPDLQAQQAQIPPPYIPEPPPPESPKPISKSIRCPGCNNSFQVELVSGTQSVTCPHCGMSGKITL